MVEVKQRGKGGSGELGAQRGVHGCDDKQSGQEREGKWSYAPLVQVTGLFVAVRLAQYILVGLTPGSGFDNSTQLLLDMYVSADAQARFLHKHILNKLLPWDSVFFIKGMMSTDVLPEYEHEFAFSITWTWTVKRVYRVLCRMCGVSETPDFYSMLTVAIALENVLYYISTLVLYHLTFLVFSPTASTTHNHYASRLAKTTAVLFVFTSAAGFTLGIYSEPMSSCFTFMGMVCREYACRDLSADTKRFQHPVRSFVLYTFATTACFTIAMLNRSNCVLLGLFYLYDLWRFALAQSFALTLLQPLLSGSAMLAALLVQQYFIPFQHFCAGSSTPSEWCADRWFSADALAFLTRSSLYSYIQSHYWHVGFLSYWTPNNIPNFLFALPNLVVMAYASFYFSWIYPQSRLRPAVLLTVAFVAAMLLFANVQIINRLATSVPLHLWYLADRLVKGGAHSYGRSYGGSDRGDDRLVRYYLCWLVAWIPAHTILFAAFLPPA